MHLPPIVNWEIFSVCKRNYAKDSLNLTMFHVEHNRILRHLQKIKKNSLNQRSFQNLLNNINKMRFLYHNIISKGYTIPLTTYQYNVIIWCDPIKDSHTVITLRAENNDIIFHKLYHLYMISSQGIKNTL